MAEKGRAQNSRNRVNDSGKRKTAAIGKTWGIIFWVVFAVVVYCLFQINRDAISRTLRETGFQVGRSADQTDSRLPMSLSFSDEQQSIQNLTSYPESTRTGFAETMGTVAGTDDTPADQNSIQETTTAVSQVPPLEPPPVLRERTLYFINVDKDGTIIRTKVNRNLPASDTPLTDVLGALIAGPAPEEQLMGLISLIPEGTRIMNTIVRGNTAYISLSEDFQYNIYGVEGYAGAVRQVVWTATEFANVRDVQILIENRRLDFLGEGVWIGSPLNRSML